MNTESQKVLVIDDEPDVVCYLETFLEDEGFDDEEESSSDDPFKKKATVDLEKVATGEHWYGSRALELNLIDEIGTSDDFLLDAAEKADLYRLSFKRPKRFSERMLQGVEGLLYR